DAIRKRLAVSPDARGPAIFDMAAATFRAAELNIAIAEDDWARVRQLVPDLEAARARLEAAYLAGGNNYPPVSFWPYMAYAKAMEGDFAAAHALIDRTPGDCDLCLRMRGRIDAAEKNFAGADTWFAKAAATAPSIPFAHEDWGRSLLARGKP